MSRPKMIRRCFTCNAEFTWEKRASVRQVNHPALTIDDFHSCKDFADDKSGKRINFPPGMSAESKPIESQQSPNISVDIETLTYKSDSIQVIETVTTLPTENKVDNKPEAGKAIYELIRPYALEDFAQANQAQVKEINHIVTIKSGDTTKVITGCHKQQAELVEYLSLGLNVLLVGPAGTGKTTAAFNASLALELDYFPISLGPQTSKSDFFGFTDAQGKAVWTVVRKAFTNGGVLLMDEIDASGAGALTYVNAILANGHAAFPSDNGDLIVATKHENFRVIAAANTYGHGSNRMYVGRQQLDAATLDRFVGIDWDYDTDLERKIGAEFMPYVEYIWMLRKKCNEVGIRAVFGTRKVINGVKLLSAGVDLERIKRDVVFFGISADDKLKLGVK